MLRERSIAVDDPIKLWAINKHQDPFLFPESRLDFGYLLRLLRLVLYITEEERRMKLNEGKCVRRGLKGEMRN